jgi:hypothetical protein
MATYFDMFGPIPNLSRHEIQRMNQRGIKPAELTAVLATQARPGTSPGTIMFVATRIHVVVDEITGEIVTSWRT